MYTFSRITYCTSKYAHRKEKQSMTEEYWVEKISFVGVPSTIYLTVYPI